jgi:transcriptional regulator with XRE-family HTH domain
MKDDPERNDADVTSGPLGPIQQPPVYNPDQLLKMLLTRLELKSNAALCRVLDVSPPLINRIRQGKSAISAPLLIRMHDISGISIRELRHMMGDRRRRFRISEKYFMPSEDAAIAMRRH